MKRGGGGGRKKERAHITAARTSRWRAHEWSASSHRTVVSESVTGSSPLSLSCPRVATEHARDPGLTPTTVHRCHYYSATPIPPLYHCIVASSLRSPSVLLFAPEFRAAFPPHVLVTSTSSDTYGTSPSIPSLHLSRLTSATLRGFSLPRRS